MSKLTGFYDDSRALLDRARKHYQEFNYLVGPAEPSLWKIDERAGSRPETYTYTLSIDWDVLTKVKPVAADIANNLVHSFDHLVGASARIWGRDRVRNLYFPWESDDEKFEAKLKKLRPVIGDAGADCILSVRERHRMWLPNIHPIKELSNSGKHWQLIPSTSAAAAIAAKIPGQIGQKIWEFAPDAFVNADWHDFAIDVPRMSNTRFQILISFGFDGLGNRHPLSPETMFEGAFRYAQDMIDTIAEAVG